MKESAVKRKIVESIREDKGYARRIEDQFSVGMPDLILMPVRCPVIWAEVKMVDGYTFHPTQRQLIELGKLRRPPHSYSMVIGWKAGILYISPPKLDIRLEDCDEQQEGESISDFIRRSMSHI